MRNLHVAFCGYLQDYKNWPQQPIFEAGTNQDATYDAWWFSVMDPYTGRSRKVWLCPVLTALHIKDSGGNPQQMDYTPTQFDMSPMSPYRWPTQPWLVEVANAHGNGPLVLFPDGSVNSLGNLVPGAYLPAQ